MASRCLECLEVKTVGEVPTLNLAWWKWPTGLDWLGFVWTYQIGNETGEWHLFEFKLSRTKWKIYHFLISLFFNNHNFGQCYKAKLKSFSELIFVHFTFNAFLSISGYSFIMYKSKPFFLGFIKTNCETFNCILTVN